MARLLKVLKCSYCGAPIKYQMGEMILTCPYCGYTSLVDQSKAFQFEHYMFVPTVNEDEAKGIIERWIEDSYLLPTKVFRKARLLSMRHKMLPFWEIWLKTTCSFKGLNYRLGEEKTIEENFSWSGFVLVYGRKAEDFPPVHIELEESKDVFDVTKLPKDISIFNAELDEEEAVQRAKETVEKRLMERVRDAVDEVIDVRYGHEIVSPSVYVHIPFWVAEYEYKGGVYQIIINEVDKEVLTAEYPEDIDFL